MWCLLVVGVAVVGVPGALSSVSEKIREWYSMTLILSRSSRESGQGAGALDARWSEAARGSCCSDVSGKTSVKAKPPVARIRCLGHATTWPELPAPGRAHDGRHEQPGGRPADPGGGLGRGLLLRHRVRSALNAHRPSTPRRCDPRAGVPRMLTFELLDMQEGLSDPVQREATAAHGVLEAVDNLRYLLIVAPDNYLVDPGLDGQLGRGGQRPRLCDRVHLESIRDDQAAEAQALSQQALNDHGREAGGSLRVELADQQVAHHHRREAVLDGGFVRRQVPGLQPGRGHVHDRQGAVRVDDTLAMSGEVLADGGHAALSEAEHEGDRRTADTDRVTTE